MPLAAPPGCRTIPWSCRLGTHHRTPTNRTARRCEAGAHGHRHRRGTARQRQRVRVLSEAHVRPGTAPRGTLGDHPWRPPLTCAQAPHPGQTDNGWAQTTAAPLATALGNHPWQAQRLDTHDSLRDGPVRPPPSVLDPSFPYKSSETFSS